MEYLNRIIEADQRSENIIGELSQTKADSYKSLSSDVTFDEFNSNKEVGIQDQVQDLVTMMGYYEEAYRNINGLSGHEFTEISDYLGVDNVKEELNRRVKKLKQVIDIYN